MVAATKGGWGQVRPCVVTTHENREKGTLALGSLLLGLFAFSGCMEPDAIDIFTITIHVQSLKRGQLP